jgi:hypothetical protein
VTARSVSSNWPSFGDPNRYPSTQTKPIFPGFDSNARLSRTSSLASLPSFDPNENYEQHSTFPSPEMNGNYRYSYVEFPDSEGYPHNLDQEIPHIPICRYFLQGYCARGDRCHFAHIVNVPAPGNRSFNHSFGANNPTQYHPGGVPVNPAMYNTSIPGVYPNQPYAYSLVKLNKFHAVQAKKKLAEEDASRFLNLNIEDLIGQIHNLCKDQHGCRFLQKKLEEDNDDVISMVFDEVFEYFTELMIGNFQFYY